MVNRQLRGSSSCVHPEASRGATFGLAAGTVNASKTSDAIMKSLSLLNVLCGSRSIFADFPNAPTRNTPPLRGPFPLDPDDPQAATNSPATPSPEPAMNCRRETLTNPPSPRATPCLVSVT
ncbi:hypothetical protein GCM10027167_67710 [Nocardia heshunensis]